MAPTWHKPRRYKHFDLPVSQKFLGDLTEPSFVSSHPMSPLLYYKKEERRYKPGIGKTVTKRRPIMYASHRDAAILSYYADQLNKALGKYYEYHSISDFSIAYRALGLSNYDFSAEAYRFAVENSPCTILAFDVSGFFDHLDHGLLKARLKRVLGLKSLTVDWLRVFRFVTRFTYVELESLKVHPTFAPRFKERGPALIGTVADLKKNGIQFHPNPKGTVGIPQGTPISAVLSNVYMIDFDKSAANLCAEAGAFYRRYSDDILIISSEAAADGIQNSIETLIGAEKLSLSADKTERTMLELDLAKPSGKAAQYLGFAYYPGGAGLRPGSLSRQWRKMKRQVNRAKSFAEKSLAAGNSGKVFTKSLRRRFSALPFRNFSSYARRSAGAFGTGEKITSQIRKLERRFEAEMRQLKAIEKK